VRAELVVFTGQAHDQLFKISNSLAKATILEGKLRSAGVAGHGIAEQGLGHRSIFLSLESAES